MKLSVIMPTIRPHLLENWFLSIQQSCKKYSFEVIMAGPDNLPFNLKQIKNIKYIKTYSHPSKANQICALNASGELLYHTVDDAYFYENAIDEAIDQYKILCRDNDGINMRYIEGKNHSGKAENFSSDYWLAGSHNSYSHLAEFIDLNWKINGQFMISRNYFIKIGGFDCVFEYLTHSCVDFLFRVQKNGGIIYDSKNFISNSDWMPTITGDHSPVHYAQINDGPIFNQIWKFDRNRSTIDINNYTKYPDIWKRRFNNVN